MRQWYRFTGGIAAQALFSMVAVVLFQAAAHHRADAAGFSAGPGMSALRSYHSATVLGNGKVLISGGYGGGYLNSTELFDPATGSLSNGPAMSYNRHYHTATPLPNGKVLIAGGSIDGTDYFPTTEVYDPVTNAFSPGPSMSDARNSHTATLLANGKILIAGGYDGLHTLAGAEIYDPSTNTFSPTSTAMTHPRQSHTATLLADGTVLIAGGFAGSTAVSSAEIYDPGTNSFSSVTSMSSARHYHTATLLPGGKVLIVGGSSDSAILQSAELYDPSTASFSPAGTLASPRYFHSANLLPDGKILITGGRNGSIYLNTAEIYNPASNTFSSTSNMLSARYLHTGIVLPNGKVMIVGGSNVTGSLRYTELYDSTTGSFRSIQDLSVSRAGQATVTLPDGKILIAGGSGTGGPTASVELFDPSLSTSTSVGSLSLPRSFLSATLLASGKVLLAGGDTGSGAVSTAELFDPATSTLSPLPAMGNSRSKHTATLLKDGTVLISGGIDGGTPLASTELFDPLQNRFIEGASMAAARHSHTSTLLTDGKVLIAGGANSAALSASELYDPANGSFQSVASLATAREGHTAMLLPSGKVLVAGGANGTGYLNTAEIYDPAAGFSTTGSMTSQRRNHRAVLLHNGSVLITGGLNSTGALYSAELFDTTANAFTPAGTMASARDAHSSVLLPDGSVLVAGGNSSTPTASAELFTIVPDGSQSRRPEISVLTPPQGGSDTCNLTGSRFAGFLDTSGGASNNSPTNVPLLQLQGVGNDLLRFIPSSNWSDTSFTSTSMYGLPVGFYHARLLTGAIPSGAKLLRVSPVASVTPSTLDFASVSLNRTSAARQLSVTNTGSTDLRIAAVSITGTDAAMYTLEQGSGCGTLGRNGACTMNISFRPTSEGVKEAAVTLLLNDPDHPSSSVPLTGTGIIVTYPLTMTGTGTGIGRIDLSTGGTCTGTCTEWILDGTTVQLTPVADESSIFSGWSGCDAVVGTTCTVALSEAKSVSAAFRKMYPVTVNFTGAGTGTVGFSTGGECTGTCIKQILEATVVTLAAVSGTSSYFAGWTGCDSVDGTTCTVTVTGDRIVDVSFRPIYQLTVGVAGTGTGSVTLPSGNTCPGACTGTFDEGTAVSLTAVPASGSYFANWSGCDSVDGLTCNVTMSSARNAVATFTVTPALSLAFLGTGAGTVTMSPGETCTGNCIKTYTTGTQVTLFPTPQEGSLFSGWTGCDSTNGNACYVTMSASKNVQVAFTAGYSLSVNVTGGGYVTLNPGGTCSGTCTQQYGTGATISLTPTTVPGGTFTGWTGCDSVSNSVCTVTMTSAKNVSASFTSPYHLYLTVRGSGTGRFDFSTGGSCTGSCNKTVLGGSTVLITPQLDPGSVLDSWTGCDLVEGTACSVMMSGGRDVSATIGLAINVGGRMYGLMQDAYDSMSSGENMMLRTYDFTGDLDCKNSVTVTLSGGYDSTFMNRAGSSSLRGNLTVTRGKVIIDNIVIQ